MAELEDDLAVAETAVGHRCPSTALAVRMNRYACECLGIDDPGPCSGLIVSAEMDRCGTAALHAVIGASYQTLSLPVGPRDIGKMGLTLAHPEGTGLLHVHLRWDVVSEPGVWPAIAYDPLVPDEDLLVGTPESCPGHEVP
jgi:formylmethanofuran dehydrogenase subunit E